MRKNSKKLLSYANTSLKKSSKIVSILVVFFLLSTVASSAMGSSRIGSKIQETVENVNEGLNNLDEKFNNFKENGNKIGEELKNKFSQIKETSSNKILRSNSASPIISFIKSIRSYFPLKNSGSLLNLYTKYA